MRSLLRPAFVALIMLTLLTGVVYPFLVTGLAWLLFPHQAGGSLIVSDGKPIGSELIGQSFDGPQYFWPRPSATPPIAYNAASSSGSNLAPTNPALAEAVEARIQKLKAADPGNTAPVPVDLVTASASGLDPHITPAAAEYQAARVARARQLDASAVRKLIAEHTEQRQLGLLGEPRVNVLKLNRTLDAVTTGDMAGAMHAR